MLGTASPPEICAVGLEKEQTTKTMNVAVKIIGIASLGLAAAIVIRVSIPRQRKVRAFNRTIPRGQITWFIHPEDGTRSPLGFVNGPRRPFRLIDHTASWYVYGGRTGSHFLGHTEEPWDKLQWIEQRGYVRLSVARDRKLVPPDWQPPVDEALRDKTVRQVLQRH